MQRLRPGSLGFVILMALFPLVVTAADSSAPRQPGKGSYRRFCASCHGIHGKGDGPMAVMLKDKPADLTQLAKNNGGQFPALKVAKIIDGRELVPGHGSSDMPVWGERFKQGEGEDSHVAETAVRERVQLLVQYLQSIQER